MLVLVLDPHQDPNLHQLLVAHDLGLSRLLGPCPALGFRSNLNKHRQRRKTDNLNNLKFHQVLPMVSQRLSDML